MDKKLIEPQIVGRARGGFMALSPKSSPICIGVIAESEQQARHAFADSVALWMKSLENELAKQPAN